MCQNIAKKIVKKINGLWSVVSAPSGSVIQFKSLSRKNAQEWADQFNAACAVPAHEQLNASAGVAVWRGRCEQQTM